ncbi:predicted protein [Nematostella vectensis]|uniref:Sorting nexin-17 n=1 Tax=Nematostella vectensis TaxID=45351 RepID=A7SGL2_NEMVE|nr:predicted protein [Nematostella vectensis]|eukprot:XP_001629235.1 predicted protein [Nematostella vectensis]
MHFSIPDTVEVKDRSGSTFLAYNIHINGALHSAVRFSDLYQFNEQLKKEYGNRITARFPPRKILSLTAVQVEERRDQLEKYLQGICQDPDVANSSTFTDFLRNCQKETLQALSETVTLDVYLMNGSKVSLKVLSTDSTDDVLEAAMREIKLSEELFHYFALFLIKREEDGEATIQRKLQEFECPYLSVKNLKGTHRIAVRKNFWDSKLEDRIIEDKIGMNLLYVQAISDIERGWVVGPKEAYSRLEELKETGSKKEYLRLARMMKYYGFIQFKPCFTNYPTDNTRVLISCGDRELNFRLQTEDNKIQEGSFKVTRMRCWRITSSQTTTDEGKKEESLELAFEYLLTRDCLQWITVYSGQAILMSLCLQSIVDEIIRLKQNKSLKAPRHKERTNGNFQRDNKVQGGYAQVPQRQAPPSDDNTKTNEVFEGIGNDDL